MSGVRLDSDCPFWGNRGSSPVALAPQSWPDVHSAGPCMLPSPWELPGYAGRNETARAEAARWLLYCNWKEKMPGKRKMSEAETVGRHGGFKQCRCPTWSWWQDSAGDKEHVECRSLQLVSSVPLPQLGQQQGLSPHSIPPPSHIQMQINTCPWDCIPASNPTPCLVQ